MTLGNSLVVFDIEATGLNIIKDRIVQVCFLKIAPNGEKEVKEYLINPQIPIPPEVTNIHGINDGDVKNAPAFKEVAGEILEFLGDADLCGFNLLKFDVPLLMEEFIRCELEFDIEKRSIIDAQTIFHRQEPRNLTAAYQFYCGKELKQAHDAKADTLATYEVLLGQLKKYSADSPTIEGASELMGVHNRVDLEGRIVLNEKGEEVFNFGKHKGKRVTQVFENEPSYYNWIMDGTFSGYTKKVVERIKLQMLMDKFGKA